MPLELATTCRDVACRVSIILVYQEKDILADGDAARHVSTDFFVSLIQCLLGICQTIDNNLNCQWFIFQQLRITFYRRIHLFQRDVQEKDGGFPCQRPNGNNIPLADVGI